MSDTTKQTTNEAVNTKHTEESTKDTTQQAVPADANNQSAASTDWKAAYIRLKADFENYKKRTLKQWETHLVQANQKLWKDFLDWIDDFERVGQSWPTAVSETYQPVKTGLDLVAHKLTDLLQSQGIEQIPLAPGDSFNPSEQEGLSALPSSPENAGKVLQVVRKGYRLQGQVIRHAQVITGAEASVSSKEQEEA